MMIWGLCSRSQYYATEAMGRLTTQSGADDDVRGAFVRNGKLDNSKDTRFRAVYDRWPVFGFAQNFGSISSRVSALFTIGLCQDEVVQFLGANGVVSLPPLWRTHFGSQFDAVSLSSWDMLGQETKVYTRFSVVADYDAVDILSQRLC